jgi:hypothetical protein
VRLAAVIYFTPWLARRDLTRGGADILDFFPFLTNILLLLAVGFRSFDKIANSLQTEIQSRFTILDRDFSEVYRHSSSLS